MKEINHPYPVGTRVRFIEEIPEKGIKCGAEATVDETPANLDHTHIYETGTYGYLLVDDSGVDYWVESYKIEIVR